MKKFFQKRDSPLNRQPLIIIRPYKILGFFFDIVLNIIPNNIYIAECCPSGLHIMKEFVDTRRKQDSELSCNYRPSLYQRSCRDYKIPVNAPHCVYLPFTSGMCHVIHRRLDPNLQLLLSALRSGLPFHLVVTTTLN